MLNTIFPVQPNDRGARVKALHETLLHIARTRTLSGVSLLLADPHFITQWNIEYKESFYGEATQKAVSLLQENHLSIRPTGTVDQDTSNAINSMSTSGGSVSGSNTQKPGASGIYGTVYNEWIEPAEGLPVLLFEVHIRSEHLLAEGETNEKGEYSLSYSHERDKENGGKNIIVRLYSCEGDALYTSDIMYNFTTGQQVNINLGPRAYMGASEFEKNTKLVKEFIGTLEIHELTENDKVHDLTYLFNKTRISISVLTQLIAAYRFEKWTCVQAEVYYGILGITKAFPSSNNSATVPTDVDTVIEKAYINFWNISLAKMMSSLQEAAAKNIVAYCILRKKEEIQASLQKLLTAPPQESTATQQLPPVYINIKTAGLSAAQQQAYLNLYSSTPAGPSFWSTLATAPSFAGDGGTAAINKLQAVTQLSSFTSNNAALTAYITQKYEINAASSFIGLVSNDVNDWVNIITASGTVPATTANASTTINTLATSLANGIEKLYPTQVFASRFTKSTTLQITNKDYIANIVNHSDFDIVKSSVGAFVTGYIKANPLPASTDVKTITYQVMGLQRTYKVAQGADASVALLSNGVQSAKQIYAMGRGSFVSQYSASVGGDAAAGVIYDRANQTQAGASHLMGQLSSRLNNPQLNVMPSYDDQRGPGSKLGSEYPDLANLFGMAPSYCECVDCESFLGIPAYVADLLDYLYQRKTWLSNGRALLQANNYKLTEGTNTYEWRRRPDIGDIDLDCENANTELPYIDIVNELLEDYIVPPFVYIGDPGTITYAEILLLLELYFAPGTIGTPLYKILMDINKLPKTPICNISLLTDQAVISNIFFTDKENFPAWLTPMPLVPQVIIRDQFITLKIIFVIGLNVDDDKQQGFDTNVVDAGLYDYKAEVANEAARTQSSAKINTGVFQGYFDSMKNEDGRGLRFGIAVQEIHQTHLTTDEISANPEYTNTNVYNSFGDPFNTLGNNKWDLYPTQIPLSMPFDLYFTEANTFLEKMGIQRYNLISTFRGHVPFAIDYIAIAYLKLSFGAADIIFTERIQPSGKDSQITFWGSLASTNSPEVDLFLAASGLSFQQLQTLLTLTFINPNGDSFITEKATIGQLIAAPCNTANMYITNMTATKFDHINRFLRLWNKLNELTTISMHELDMCIMSTAVGNGSMLIGFGVNMYYFLQLMNQLGLTATQTLCLYQDIDNWKDIYNTDDISLYKQLFQNRQVSNPLVAAFNVPLNTTSLITDTKTNPGAIPVILTTCGITQDDLNTIMTVNSGQYSHLTMDNLSFIYACGLLTNALSISVADLFTFTSLVGINPLHTILSTASSATPSTTVEFITKFNEAQQAGFSVDVITYILANQSTANPSLIPNATSVVTGLLNIKTALQAAITGTAVAPDPQGALLKKWLSDPDLNWDSTIAAKLLSILSSAGTAGYAAQVQNNLRFLQLLNTKYNQSGTSVYLDVLPSLVFPDKTIAGISFDNANYYLFYYETMSADILNFLKTAAPADATTQVAIQSLYQQSQTCPISAVPLAGGAAWANTLGQSVPALSGGTGVLGFIGQMSAAVYGALLAQSSDSTYNCALSQLFIASQSATAGGNTFVQLAALPAISLPASTATGLSYNATTQLLSFVGSMGAADAMALLGLSSDIAWQTAIADLYTSAVAGQTTSVSLTALPATWASLPDISTIGGLSFTTGTLSFTGALTAAQQTTLLGLSGETAYTNAIKLLYALSQTNATSSVALASLPSGVSLPVAGVTGLAFSPTALCFKGQMTSAVETALISLNANGTWKPAIQTLYTNSQSTVISSVNITALPAGLTAANFPLFGVDYTAAVGSNPATLTYTGYMSDVVYDQLVAANTDTNWAASITSLYQAAQDALVCATQLTLPTGLTDGSFAGIAGVKSATTGTTTVLSATGQISPSVYQQLQALSGDPTYSAAIAYLFAQTSAIIPFALPTIALPIADANIYSASYTPGYILFTGVPNADCMDEFNLEQLNTDTSYTGAIGWIYSKPADGSSGAVLKALPSITLPIGIAISWSAGELSFVGQMQPSDYTTLQALSTDASYQATLSTLNAASQVTSVAVLPALPSGVTPASLAPLNCQQIYTAYVLSFTGVITAAMHATLLALSADATFQAVINNLYNQSLPTVQTSVPLAALPGITIPSSAQTAYDAVNNVLYYSGAYPMPAATKATLAGLSTAPEFQNALNLIAAVATKPTNYLVYAPPPQTPFATSGITLYQGSSSASISYVGGTLGFQGVMSFADYVGLHSLSTDAGYTEALNYVYVNSQSLSGSTPIQSNTYFSLPAVSIPALYASQISYADATSTLTLRGYIAAADQSALLSVSTEAAYQQAINSIYTQVNEATAPLVQLFANLYLGLWPQLYGALNAPAAADLYTFFLTAISPVYQPAKQMDALQAQVAGNFGLTAAVSAMLVKDLPSLVTIMTNPIFTANTKAINPDANQSQQAWWYLKLARIAFVATSFNLSAADIDWIIKNWLAVGAFDITAFPGNPDPIITFTQWEVLNNLYLFNKKYAPINIPDPANVGQNISLSVFTIISEALAIKANITASPQSCNPSDLINKLHLLTGWNQSELLYLLNVGQPNLPNLIINPLNLPLSSVGPAGSTPALADIANLMLLSGCFGVAGKLKVVPSRCVTWMQDPIFDTTAVDIKQALKALYPDQASWMSAVQPLMNTIRQARRDALLAYLLSNKVKNAYGHFSIFPDEYHAYGNFLIDIEMAACQPTTRLIQAYCSIQLFVQRCLMNIEAPAIVVNTTLDEDWAQWAWMGTFETWYLARYTLLYPENFIVPQALPYQSSFFSDMQNDLTQGAVTTDIVQTAYGNYLQSLDDVARLQVKGMWYDHPNNTLHVFARTRGGDPAIYYYRTLNAIQQWSPWEKVSADISGDQIIPVVQNGRVYLYWPVFAKASDDDKSTKQVPASGGGSTAPPPLKYWNIQMAYSEYVNGQWTGKKVSTDYLSSQTIIAGTGSPVIYPDTTEFVFFALDIPNSYSDVNAGLMYSLQNNSNMYIACYQSIPNSLSVVFGLTLLHNNAYKASTTITLTISDHQNPAIQIQDFFNGFNYSIDGNQVNFTSPIGPIYLTQGDPCSLMQGIMNPQLAGGDTFNISISYNINASPDTLSLINQVSNPISPYNAFLLDPVKGFCTAVDLQMLDNNNPTMYHRWLNNSNMDDMLAVSSGSVVSSDGNTILGNSQGQGYGALLPFQMSIWTIEQNILAGVVNLQQLGALMPFFFQDASCTFFVKQGIYYGGKFQYYQDVVENYENPLGDPGETSAFFSGAPGLTLDTGSYYQFQNFYHPYAHQFIRIFAKPTLGINAILPRAVQLTGDPTYGSDTDVLNNPIINIQINPGYAPFNFQNIYGPNGSLVDIDPVYGGHPIEQIDFGPLSIAQFSGYGQYNWELFYHGVLMSAIMLSQNQQFFDADRWFKFIFNPTDTSNATAPQKFWVTKPFFENTSSSLTLDEIILIYEADPAAQALFWLSVNLWRNDPYDPHMLAQLRITPYMYTAFMKYLDNLIAWANSNYQQYTMESVNIAIQLYMTALECLGPEPVAIPPVVETPVLNYYQMEIELELLSIIDGPEGYLSDPIVQFENLLPAPSANPGKPGSNQKIQTFPGLYFCIPPNPVLLSYWTTINTQLTKIRNCMNIAGQFQPLSPFPNVPGMGNMDGSGISDFGGVLPNYRFSVMIQKATELCNEVKSLGASLLSALEKDDAEALALLRASQEIAVQQSVDQVKQLQITDAQLALQVLQNNLQTTNDKIAYYSGLVQSGLIPLEQQALSLNQFSLTMEGPITAASTLASVLKLLPNLTLGAEGFGGSPAVDATWGGQQLGGAVDCFVQLMTAVSHFADKSASIASTNAGYARRLAEWNFQLTLANDELAQINSQIQGAQNRIAVATQDEKNQQLLIQNAQDVESFLTGKYTSQQLYSWMVTQISNVYFQSYQLAYGFAKQAEICFGYELGITGASYINYGYWDTLHKGLLSGEALMNSLKKMETDYYNLNIREYELTRQISLAQLDPVALLKLKDGESCFITIPEELFDLDYPGHYFRRIKHVAITLPGIVGPYTPVCLKLTLMSNSVRIDSTAGSANNYPRHVDSNGNPTNDIRFLDNVAATQYIATSNGVNDAGLFETNLHDDRYLPFERAGAISSWKIEFPGTYPQFDTSTITDLIIHFSYTSRDGGAVLQTVASQSVQAKLKSTLTSQGLVLMRGFSARRDFPTQWYKFLNPANPADTQQLVMDITNRLPYFTNGLKVKITQVVLVADVPANNSGTSALSNLYLTGQKMNNALLSFVNDPDFGQVNMYSSLTCKDAVGVWKVSNGTGQGTLPPTIAPGDITDLAIIFYYSLQ